MAKVLGRQFGGKTVHPKARKPKVEPTPKPKAPPLPLTDWATQFEPERSKRK